MKPESRVTKPIEYLQQDLFQRERKRKDRRSASPKTTPKVISKTKPSSGKSTATTTSGYKKGGKKTAATPATPKAPQGTSKGKAPATPKTPKTTTPKPKTPPKKTKSNSFKGGKRPAHYSSPERPTPETLTPSVSPAQSPVAAPSYGNITVNVLIPSTSVPEVRKELDGMRGGETIRVASTQVCGQAPIAQMLGGESSNPAPTQAQSPETVSVASGEVVDGDTTEGEYEDAEGEGLDDGVFPLSRRRVSSFEMSSKRGST